MLMTMRVQESRVLEICTHGLTRGTGETPSLLYRSFAAKIRKVYEAEPYKGKGVRYVDEVVRRKAGKTVTK